MSAGRVLITGAGGFVGGAVARRLVEAGYDAVALAASPAAAARAASTGARPVAGDLLDVGSLLRAARDAELVVHAAGVVAACRRDPSDMIRANVIGTRNVVRAAAEAGARRVVLTSSAATIGERAGEVGREDAVHRGWFLTAYERSKAEAEAISLALGAELGLEVVAVNPASVQGPGRADGTARLLLAAARGRLPVAVRTTLSFVDVDDCARGHVLAAERGRPGRRYILCGASLTVREALELVGEATGRRRRTLVVPASLVARLGGPVEAAFRAARRDPPFCRELAAALVHGRAYDGSRAVRELGLRYTPPVETLRRTIAWFEEQGALRRRRDGRAGLP